MEKQTFFRKCKATLSALNKFRIEKNITFSAMRARFFGFSKKFKENVPTAIQNMATDEVTDYFMSVKKIRYLRIAGVTSLFVLLILATCFAHPFMSYSEEVEAAGQETDGTVTIYYDSEDDKNASVDIDAHTASGTFSKSSDENSIRFGVTTNGAYGYNLKMVAKGPNALVNTANESQKIESISQNVTESVFSSSDIYNKKYGIYYKTPDSTESEDPIYHPAPVPNTEGISLANTTKANPDTRDNYQISIGARANYATPEGTYKNGDFEIRATANSKEYTIKYKYGNISDITPDSIPDQHDLTTSTSVVLNPTATPSRTGWEFVGWCYGTPNEDMTGCTGTAEGVGIYRKGDFIKLNTTGSMTLYAMWTKYTHSLTINFAGDGVSKVDIRTASGTGGELKGTVSTSGGSVEGLVQGARYYLYPTFKTGYEFDGWESSGSGIISSATDFNPMFTVGDGDGVVTIKSRVTPEPTPVPTTMQGFSDADAAAMSEGDTIDLMDVRDTNTYTVTKIGDNVWMTQNLRFIGTHLDNTTTNINTSKNIYYTDLTEDILLDEANIHNSGNTTDGVWYNYAAASALTVSSGSSTTQYSLCPAGWKLPTNEDFDTIKYKIDAFKPVTTGIYYKTPQGPQFFTGYAYWWSASNSYNRHGWFYYKAGDSSGKVSFAEGSYEYSGVYVRCIFGNGSGADVPTPSPVIDMQNFTAQDAENMQIGNVVRLKDNRDNQIYMVGKLKDGKVWMLNNLNLGVTDLWADLDSSNTNISNSISKDEFNSMRASEAEPSLDTGLFAPVPGSDSSSYTDYGTLYNYCIASGKTICTYSTLQEGVTATDICPAGWKLPTGGSNGDFKVLYGYYNYNEMRMPISNDVASFAATLAGQFYQTVKNTGTYGIYWSSVYTGQAAYTMDILSDSIRDDTTSARASGYSIRCIFNN